MLLIPAIDIKDGKCVRLRRGDMTDPTVFDDPDPRVRQLAQSALARRKDQSTS